MVERFSNQSSATSSDRWLNGYQLSQGYDDVALYKEIKSESSVDCDLLQAEDLNSVYFWSDRWELCLSPPKCEALSITNKRCPITTTYTVNGVSLRWSTSVRYLGLHITSNLCWSKHCVIIAAKATKCLTHLLKAYFVGCHSTSQISSF